MISQKSVHEYCPIKGDYVSYVFDLLPYQDQYWCILNAGGKSLSSMTADLHSALKAMSIEEDEPINLPDEPQFRVFEENELSVLGRLLNPDCQAMSRLIEDMPRHWRLIGRVRGIALSREKFQFIFKREEDLLTVLNDRPWSFNHWTMLLERWTESPPDDFLTKFEVWVRIRNIPCNHYTLETMRTLAKAAGAVIDVAYDPKFSQKTDFIRAKVLFDISKPARDEKLLNIPGGKGVMISYEYEKLRKKCFHCFRLTHEKSQCPLLKKGSHLAKNPSALPASTSKPNEKPLIEAPPALHMLEGPPGFPPLFPELSKEDRRSALMYVAHSDTTERMARIERVNHHIEDLRSKKDDALPLFSTDLLKEKGMVFKYDNTGDKLRSISTRCVSQSRSAPVSIKSQELAPDESEQISSSHLVTEISTGFHMGSSSKSPVSGSLSSQKKPRNRPPAWKRRLRKLSTASQTLSSDQDAVSLEGGNKRKSDDAAIQESKKQNQNIESPVASVLKPLPIQ